MFRHLSTAQKRLSALRTPLEGRGSPVEMLEQLQKRGIADPRVLESFRRTPREEFVPENLVDRAYADSPLPIGFDQTISQPYVVALTAEALELSGDERVLEIGTGSGYAAAILSRVAREVFSVERIAALAEAARARLERLGYDNVHVLCSDGTLGWPQLQPYDAIAVSAGASRVPEALLAQLGPGGRLVMPLGPPESQVLTRVARDQDSHFQLEALCPVRFVPLIGEQGESQESD